MSRSRYQDGDPRILIEHGKHGESYYWVPTLELLDAAALELLREKMQYDLTPLSDADREAMAEYRVDAELTDEQIAALPGSYDIKAEAEKKRSYAQSNLKWYEDREKEYEQAVELAALSSTIRTEKRKQRDDTVKTVRYSAAWRFLDEITDGDEYGRLSLEYPRVVEPSTTTAVTVDA